MSTTDRTPRLPNPRTLALLTGLLGATASPLLNRTEALLQLYYLREVAGYCGLLNPQLAAGFRRQRRDIMQRDGVTDSMAQGIRMLAWKAADYEWADHGLGGFRGWCRTEGRTAVLRLHPASGSTERPQLAP